jgi:iron-sulfur cluster repair protein YtfE (RIC family)
MNGRAVDPVRELGHNHASLTKLAAEIGRLVRAGGDREQIHDRVEILREELLAHFADEEEAFFPFLRAHVPAKAAAVDRLEAGHDSICGAVVRLSHLAARDPAPAASALTSLYERFEEAYAKHSQEEADLFVELGRTLDAEQRAKLAELMRGL